MLRIDSRNMNLTGSSTINNDVVATFTATVNDPNPNPDAYISMNISNIESFRTNLSAIKDDIDDFLTEVAKVGQ